MKLSKNSRSASTDTTGEQQSTIQSNHSPVSKQVDISGHRFNFLISRKSDKPYVVFVPGFQSRREKGIPLLETLGISYITFDFPGTYSNSTYFNGRERSFDIVGETSKIIRWLLSNYEVKILTGASISTHLLFRLATEMLNSHQRLNIILISPQIDISFIDKAMSVLMRLFIGIQKVTKSDWFNKFVNISAIRSLWINAIAKDTKRDLTMYLLHEDFKYTSYYTGCHSYLAFVKSKKFFIKEYQSGGMKIPKSLGDRIQIIHGNRDNLLNMDAFEKFLDLTSFDRTLVHVVKSNHIVETEAIEEIAPIFLKVLNK